MNNPNAKDNLKPFKKGKDARRNLDGRPPKLISTVNTELEQRGIKEATKQDIVSCYLRLMQLDLEEIEEISEMRIGMPLLYPIVAKCVLKGKGLDVIEKMLDRAIGKAEQKTDNTHTLKDFNLKEVLKFDSSE